ncbi:hypothetical protein B296_00023921 [Ensete ventricosum]|uniref:GST N-terminal domain-containing protein n=1 Tax=Ensete ventricosum TaxID=4639 RepID=A0A427ASA7_ENSVE|nr:hypothetical protein B296_00023921 [Ensete ventricosum]
MVGFVHDRIDHKESLIVILFVNHYRYSVSLVSEDKIPPGEYALKIAGKMSILPEGDGTTPLMLSLGLLTTLTEGFAMIGRMGKGSSYSPSKLPPMPLEIWAYEGSPFCKIVREVLVELELPHILHRLVLQHRAGQPKEAGVLQESWTLSGSSIKLICVCFFGQVPYLEDPNTGVKMFESAEIVDYLRTTYAL